MSAEVLESCGACGAVYRRQDVALLPNATGYRNACRPCIESCCSPRFIAEWREHFLSKLLRLLPKIAVSVGRQNRLEVN